MREYKDKVPQYEEIKDARDFKEKEILAVDKRGLPKEFIRPDALYSDKQAFWNYHEKKVLMGLACCMMYFILILVW